jgi:small subunit ribosomal protein S17
MKNKEEECGDPNCPKHGKLKVRGMTLEGTVVSDKMKNSVVVEIPRLIKVRKYERYKRRKSRLTAHVPACIKVELGEKVRIGEARRISKTKSFVVTEVLKE